MKRNVIVVGVDGSDSGRRALHWALDEAARTGAAVDAVTAWHYDGIEAMVPAATTPMEHREWADRVSARDVTAALTRRPSVPVSRTIVEGPAPRVLAEAARDAHLLVLGCHGHSRLHHAVLGSVSEECIRAATCPVVVVPIPHHQRTQVFAERIPVRK
jgi:nucleotide-binding universal stress UspA family protein